MVMHLKTCCCGCTLKTGTVIIGVLTAIGAVSWLILCIMGASLGTGSLQKELVHELEKERDQSPDPEKYDKAIKDIEHVEPSTTLSVVFISLAIANAIQLILSILLVFGASAERPRLVKPWIIYAIIALVVQTILMIVRMINNIAMGALTSALIGFIGIVIGVAIEVYFILVVNSYHTELISNNFLSKV